MAVYIHGKKHERYEYKFIGYKRHLKAFWRCLGYSTRLKLFQKYKYIISFFTS